MCDTMVALPGATARGIVLFAKNSDRDPNEAQVLTYVPRTQHPEGAVVRCTNMEVPQVRETYAVLLSRPFWMWGCEMGVNEHGVVMGNEAVFTREPYEKRSGLLGMDMMRLALERAATAREGLDWLVRLLETYGQGGNCGFARRFYYHNAFLIADPREAWVLETAGRRWAARQVHDVYAISNGLTIGAQWDRASDDLAAYAVERGWCRSVEDFDFARCYSDRLYTPLSGCASRRARALDLLSDRTDIDVPGLMAVLRDHGAAAVDDPDWHPAPADPTTLCMHAGFGPTRASQSVASMVVALEPEGPVAWVTGTSAPCTGVFKPVWVRAGLPELGPEPTGVADPDSLYWQHERLHRALLLDRAPGLLSHRAERDALEQEFLRGARAVGPDEAAQRDFSAACFARAREATADWLARVERNPASGQRVPLFYRLAWRGFERRAGR